MCTVGQGRPAGVAYFMDKSCRHCHWKTPALGQGDATGHSSQFCLFSKKKSLWKQVQNCRTHMTAWISQKSRVLPLQSLGFLCEKRDPTAATSEAVLAHNLGMILWLFSGASVMFWVWNTPTGSCPGWTTWLSAGARVCGISRRP